MSVLRCVRSVMNPLASLVGVVTIVLSLVCDVSQLLVVYVQLKLCPPGLLNPVCRHAASYVSVYVLLSGNVSV